MTERLAGPLETEDYCIQSMPDVSPTKWHLAHSTWFFERFVLAAFVADYRPVHPGYEYLFNSYYNTVGPMHCRARRGVLSRPTVAEVYAYRKTIDERVGELLQGSSLSRADRAECERRVALGIEHEQQHQELLVTDIKHVLSSNPLLPAYHRDPIHEDRGEHAEVPAINWVDLQEGVYDFGYDGEGFHFDNEGPRHKGYVSPCCLADRLVTNGEYLRFIEDGGYREPKHWLAMGWATVQHEGWTHPLYWYRDPDQGDRWMQYTLHGPRELRRDEPAMHLSYFEADAYARWAGARLPTEREWEAAAALVPVDGRFAQPDHLHPAALDDSALSTPASDQVRPSLHQMFGQLWQWTSSAYDAYPGYQPADGALGEYNGKFMCNQYVLRGGSCATPAAHYRKTYRNFFPPIARWQYSGVRLAKSLPA